MSKIENEIDLWEKFVKDLESLNKLSKKLDEIEVNSIDMSLNPEWTSFNFDEKIQYIKRHPLEHNFIVQNNSNPDKSKIYYFKLELIDEYIYSDQYSFVIAKTFDNVNGEEVNLFFVCDWSNGERNFLTSYLKYLEPAIDRYLEKKNLIFKSDNSNILYYKEQVEETKNQLEDGEKKSEDSNSDKEMFAFLIIIIILGFVMLLFTI